MSWKVLITARTFNVVGAAALDLLRNAGCDIVMAPRFGPLPAGELLPLLKDADVVLASTDEYSEAVLSSPEAARLKVISRWGVGYDSIDLAAASRLGIVIAYTPGVLDEAVADFTFGMLLALARRIHEGHSSMRAGQWNLVWGHDVFGKTLGVLGFGRIGQAVARRASGFNMRVLTYDPKLKDDPAPLGVIPVGFEELLEQSDYLSLHAALTPQNRGLIGEKELRRMKPTAYLVNAARGALVDEAALVRALKEGWIAGAALDTFTKEPLAADHPLRTAPNVLLCPHLASFARDTGERVSMTAAQAVVDLKNGRRPQFVVNEEVLRSKTLRAVLK